MSVDVEADYTPEGLENSKLELMSDFKDATIKSLLSEVVSSFYSDHILCDVQLVTKTTTINAHRLVLAAISPYFRARFSFAANESTISIPYSGEDIKTLLKYIYTGEISINPENVFTILELEDFFQIASLRFLCCNFLISWINNDNVWSIKREAEYYRYKDVAEEANMFIRRQFQQLITLPSFLEVPFDFITEFLSSEFLAVPREDKLLYNLAKWVAHNTEERLSCLIPILDKIDVTAIDNWNGTKTEVLDLFGNCEVGFNLLSEWFNRAVERRRLEEPGEMNRYKESMAHVLLSIGGLDTSGAPVGSVDCIKSLEDIWKPTLCISKGAKATKDSWTVLPVMKTPRASPVIASTGSEVYVLGGTEKKTELEVFRSHANTWETLPSFPIETLVEPSMAVIDGSLYCSGGSYYKDDQLIVSNEFWVLHANSKAWAKLTPMKNARYYHHLVASSGCIFAVGGLSQGDIPISEVEKYEAVLDIWIEVTLLPGEMPYVSCCLPLHQFIYLFSGDNIYSYYPLKNKWNCVHYSRENLRSELISSRIYCVRFGSQVVKSNNNYHSLLVYSLLNGCSTEWPNQRKVNTGLSSILVPLYNPPQL